MQLKLFQYKQVEQPQQEGVSKRKGCCCGRLFVTACLIALLITFTAFVVPQLYSTVDEDSLDSSSDEVIDLLANAEMKSIQRSQLNEERMRGEDSPDSASGEVVNLLANRQHAELDAKLDAIEAEMKGRKDQLDDSASEEVVVAKVMDRGFKGLYDYYAPESDFEKDGDDVDREVRADLQKKEKIEKILKTFSSDEEDVDKVAPKVEPKGLQRTEKNEKILKPYASSSEEIFNQYMSDKVAQKDVQRPEKIKEVMELKDDDDKCAGVRSCLVDYYALWDIDASDALPPYVKFFNKLQSNFDKLHEFAIDLICLAQEEVRNCMADELAENSDIDECLSVQGWMENFELKKLDAREYAADFRVRGFECKNEDFLKENFKCLYPTTQTRKDDLDVCSSDLKKAIAEHQPVCDAMDDYITCARGIFVEECGPKVSSFVCNIVETSMLFNYPSCRPDFQTCQ